MILLSCSAPQPVLKERVESKMEGVTETSLHSEEEEDVFHDAQTDQSNEQEEPFYKYTYTSEEIKIKLEVLRSERDGMVHKVRDRVARAGPEIHALTQSETATRVELELEIIDKEIDVLFTDWVAGADFIYRLVTKPKHKYKLDLGNYETHHEIDHIEVTWKGIRLHTYRTLLKNMKNKKERKDIQNKIEELGTWNEELYEHWDKRRKDRQDEIDHQERKHKQDQKDRQDAIDEQERKDRERKDKQDRIDEQEKKDRQDMFDQNKHKDKDRQEVSAQHRDKHKDKDRKEGADQHRNKDRNEQPNKVGKDKPNMFLRWGGRLERNMLKFLVKNIKGRSSSMN